MGVPQSFKHLLPTLTQLFVPHRWNNMARVQTAVDAGWRVNVIHGILDRIVPVSMGRELHRVACAAGAKIAYKPGFVEIAKAGHNDVLMRALPEYAKLMAEAYRTGCHSAGSGSASSNNLPSSKVSTRADHGVTPPNSELPKPSGDMDCPV